MKLGLNYKFNIENSFDRITYQNKKDISQTLHKLDGNLSITKNWKITGNTTYDFSKHKFSYAQFTINRDLHCWEMSFTFIPFGT